MAYKYTTVTIPQAKDVNWLATPPGELHPVIWKLAMMSPADAVITFWDVT